jgi:hypothetical protein
MVSIPQSNTYSLVVFGGDALLGAGACEARNPPAPSITTISACIITAPPISAALIIAAADPQFLPAPLRRRRNLHVNFPNRCVFGIPEQDRVIAAWRPECTDAAPERDMIIKVHTVQCICHTLR